MPDYEKAARFLYNILESIEKAGETTKNDDISYRATVERLQARRFDVAAVLPDGNSVVFYEDPDIDEDAVMDSKHG